MNRAASPTFMRRSLPHERSRIIPLDARIHTPGHDGLVGSAIMRRLQTDGYANILTQLGWTYRTELKDGVGKSYAEFLRRHTDSEQ